MAATATLGAIPQRGLPLYSWPEYGIPLALPFVAARACLTMTDAVVTALTLTNAAVTTVTPSDAAVTAVTLSDGVC